MAGKKKTTPAADNSSAAASTSASAPPRSLLVHLFGISAILVPFALLSTTLLGDTDEWVCFWEDLQGRGEALHFDASDARRMVHGTQAHNDTMLWGTYRPQVYFGLRTREEKSFHFGLAWGVRGDMRYTAENDPDVTFGWRMHDGLHAGVQEIVDKKNGVRLTTSFLKHPPLAASDKDLSDGGEWSVRVEGKRFPGTRQPPVTRDRHGNIVQGVVDKALIVAPIFASDLGGMRHAPVSVHGPSGGVKVYGATEAAGNFKVTVSTAVASEWRVRSHTVPADRVWDVTQAVLAKMWRKAGGKEEAAEDAKNAKADANLMTVSQVFDGDFVIEITMSRPTQEEKGMQHGLTGCRYERTLAKREEAYEERFAEVFGRSGLPVEHFALSNMLGGVGYWHGEALRDDGSVIPAAALFSAVPSRAKFPRGFLWDEGFHQLLVGRWHPEISKDILLSWVSQMEASGWIAREQIRGPEPRSRVPQEFVAQSPSVANPPTLLLQVQTFAQDTSGAHTAFSRAVYPYMKRWYEWFKKTQAGAEPHTFRWRGKKDYLLLASGLDDYPRSKCMTNDEKHVDLHSWMILMTDTMASLATADGATEHAAELKAYRAQLKASLLANHWDAEKQQFSDVQGCPVDPEAKKQPAKHTPFVGYINLFPLLCGALDKETDADKILAVVRTIKAHLLTDFGIRSLSAKWQKKLKKHDNYWTGPIWINLNYMFTRAVETYGYADVHPEVADLHRTVKERVYSLIVNEYERSGKVWENYDPVKGTGTGTAPFTGWTSLFLLMKPDAVAEAPVAEAAGGAEL